MFALNDENTSGFPSEPICSTPTIPLPLCLQAPSPFSRGTRLRSRCVTRSFRLSTRFGRSSFQVFSQRQNTHMSCMYDLAINKNNHDTTDCWLRFYPQKTHSFTRCKLTGVYRLWSSRTQNSLRYFSRPGSSYRCLPPNTFRSERAQPPKRERLGFPENLRGPRARRTCRQKDADCGPPPEEHSPEDQAEFRVPAP